MAITTRVKETIKLLLRGANLKLDTLTAEKAEADRIQRQNAIGQFREPAFPLLDGMQSFDGRRLAQTYATCRGDPVCQPAPIQPLYEIP